ncbi:hypothetical protein P8452_50514 [Trifolium repens]|nr:hypothetical protein P8452_50514 [Trifolium repens]
MKRREPGVENRAKRKAERSPGARFKEFWRACRRRPLPRHLIFVHLLTGRSPPSHPSTAVDLKHKKKDMSLLMISDFQSKRWIMCFGA